MSIEEENKAVMCRFSELVNQKNVAAIREMITPDFITHRTTCDMSRDEWEQEGEMLFANYPDYSYVQEHMIAEGDKVAYREICSGTHAPTGKKVEWINTNIMRIADGKLAECWCTLDELSMMQQIGVIPSL